MKRKCCVLTIIIIIIILGLYYKGIALFDYSGIQDGEFDAKIIEGPYLKNYVTSYIAKVNEKKFILYIPKTFETFKYGDVVKIEASYSKPQGQRNYGGFDYSRYLKTKKIYGILKAKNAKKEYNIYDGKVNFIEKYNKFINDNRNFIKGKIEKNISKDNAELLIGILIGDISNLSTEIQENFRNASLTHMLAVSGDHFSYIILAVGLLTKKLKNKNFGNYFTIFVVIFFIGITGATSSVMRAGIMAIMIISSKIFHRRADIWTSMSMSLLIQIIINPYVIFDVGTLLSYGGVIGIVCFYKKINNYFIKLKNKYSIKFINDYIINAISVTLAANTIIIPIMMYNFNTISYTFIISNLLAGSLMGCIVLVGFISVIINFKPIFIFLELIITLLKKIAEICGKLPFSNVMVVTPRLITIIFIYAGLIFIYKFGNRPNNLTKRKAYLIIILIVIISNINVPINQNLMINFIDVGQGDSTLVRAKGITMLIDSGGSLDDKFDEGKSTLTPYLLDRRIDKIDYVIISHFDSDHCQGFINVIENIKVKNIIIGKQFEEYENYKKIIKLAKNKNIKVSEVSAGNIINLNKNFNLQVLWPLKENVFTDNIINNNSLVFKLIYNDFSVLFTGDIEEVAERKILEKYKNNNDILKSDMIKIAHHGSKTSSINEFINVVNPCYAMIGVGKDNKFGHPSQSTIYKLKQRNIHIYRTDEMGEISMLFEENNNRKIKNIKVKEKIVCQK